MLVEKSRGRTGVILGYIEFCPWRMLALGNITNRWRFFHVKLCFYSILDQVGISKSNRMFSEDSELNSEGVEL